MDVLLIGDEIHADGYLVAIIVQTGAPHTVIGDFEACIHSGTFYEPESDACPHCEATVLHENSCKHHVAQAITAAPDVYTAALDDAEARAVVKAKGGILRVSELKAIFADLRTNQ
jgi:hypothetical protein